VSAPQQRKTSICRCIHVFPTAAHTWFARLTSPAAFALCRPSGGRRGRGGDDVTPSADGLLPLLLHLPRAGETWAPDRHRRPCPGIASSSYDICAASVCSTKSSAARHQRPSALTVYGVVAPPRQAPRALCRDRFLLLSSPVPQPRRAARARRNDDGQVGLRGW
jgi:hypothetical protein